MDTPTKSENPKNEGETIFLNLMLKAICPEWSRIIVRSFVYYLSNKLYSKHRPPEPLDPKSIFLSEFLGFSIGNVQRGLSVVRVGTFP